MYSARKLPIFFGEEGMHNLKDLVLISESKRTIRFVTRQLPPLKKRKDTYTCRLPYADLSFVFPALNTTTAIRSTVSTESVHYASRFVVTKWFSIRFSSFYRVRKGHTRLSYTQNDQSRWWDPWGLSALAPSFSPPAPSRYKAEFHSIGS